MSKKNNVLMPVFSVLVIVIFSLVLILPEARKVFKELSSVHPFIMGFVKFAFLATVGEILALRVAAKCWKSPVKIFARFIIWGLIGFWITYMMKIYSAGVDGLMKNGLLPGADSTFLKALYTSATMNLTFGPTFMAVHKCSDKYLELKNEDIKDISVGRVVGDVDWKVFVKFTLFKTVPIFWIPAHTITFMLPVEYQVIMAAALSLALGLILSIKK